jgi:hypothetical protein
MYEHFIRYALERGHTLTVDYGKNDYGVKQCTDEQVIVESMRKRDECYLHVRREDGFPLGWLYVANNNKRRDRKRLFYAKREFTQAWYKEYNSCRSSNYANSGRL